MSAASFAAFALLGHAATTGAMAPLDRAASAVLFGALPAVAWAFTQTGYTPFLAVASVFAFFVVRRFGGAFWLVPVAVASQLTSQGIVEVLKGAFGRPRPTQYIGVHELGLSYPSGHATTAVVFYVFWAIALWHSRASRAGRVAGCLALCAWALAIDASRVALGAHYASDVFGGTAFGAGWLALGFALAPSRDRAVAPLS